jgi:hypothetical protein
MSFVFWHDEVLQMRWLRTYMLVGLLSDVVLYSSFLLRAHDEAARVTGCCNIPVVGFPLFSFPPRCPDAKCLYRNSQGESTPQWRV